MFQLINLSTKHVNHLFSYIIHVIMSYLNMRFPHDIEARFQFTLQYVIKMLFLSTKRIIFAVQIQNYNETKSNICGKI